MNLGGSAGKTCLLLCIFGLFYIRRRPRLISVDREGYQISNNLSLDP